MSQFLRDEVLKNLTIDQDALSKINEDLVEIVNKFNTPLRTQIADDNLYIQKALIRTYIIRFDGKGFHLYDFQQVMKCFGDAKNVERVIFQVDSIESKGGLTGKRIDIRFDSGNADNCSLLVQDDDKDWVDCTFIRLKDRICKHTNKNRYVRHQGTVICIQFTGVILGLVFSAWAAITVAPLLKIDNALLFAFIGAFLLYSNAWTFLFDRAIKFVNFCWPNVRFRKPSGMHWFLQSIVASTAFLVMAFILSRIFHYLAQVFNPVLK